jgi:hypothetical protein
MGVRRIKARYTGNKKVCYRWLAEMGSGEVRRAQDFVGARVAAETWSEQVDARVARATIVEVDVPAAGLLMIDAESATTHGGRTYTAAVLSGDSTVSPDWTRARWISIDEVEVEHEKRLVHTVEIDGRRQKYTVSR